MRLPPVLVVLILLARAVPGAAQVVSIGDVAQVEGDTGISEFDLIVALDVPQPFPVTVDWETVPRGGGPTHAQPGSDFVPESGVLVIDPFASSATVSVSVVGDYVDETDEFFDVVLSNPAGAAIGDPSGQVTILDDDASVSIGDLAMAEGDIGFTTFSFPVTLNRTKSVSVSATWTVTEAPAVSATAGVDFVSETGTVTVEPGAQQATVDVHVIGDTQREGTEQFLVVLSNPVFGSLGDGIGLGQILNDDAAISVSDPAVAEGDAEITSLAFTVSLDLVENSDVQFDYTTSGGSAVPGDDYEPVTGTGVIPQGGLSVPVVVLVYGDLDYETNETVQLQLSNPVGASIGKATGLGVIQNDDPFPTVSVGDAQVSEGDDGTTALSFEFTLSAKTILSAALNYETADGTATAPGDYTARSGGLSFSPGQTVGTIDVLVQGDTDVEADETLEMHITGVLNAALGDASGTGTILDDDTPAPPAAVPALGAWALGLLAALLLGVRLALRSR